MFPSLAARETSVAETNFAARKQKLFLPGVKNTFAPRTQILRPKHKVLANEDTLLRTNCCSCFLGCANWEQLLRTQNVSEQNQEHFCVPDTKFVSATNVTAGKRGYSCVGNNVSATMCPRLPVPICFPV